MLAQTGTFSPQAGPGDFIQSRERTSGALPFSDRWVRAFPSSMSEFKKTKQVELSHWLGATPRAWTHPVEPAELGSRGVPGAPEVLKGLKGPLLRRVTVVLRGQKNAVQQQPQRVITRVANHAFLASCSHVLPSPGTKVPFLARGLAWPFTFTATVKGPDPAPFTAPCLAGSLSMKAELSFPRSALAVCVLSSVSSGTKVASRGDRCDKNPKGARLPALQGRKAKIT